MADAQKVGLTTILTMKKGDMVRGEYRRGAANHSFSFPVPELPRVPLFKRTRPAGRVDVKASGNRIDVTARGVARYTLLIRREMFDLDRPIQVIHQRRRELQRSGKARPGFHAGAGRGGRRPLGRLQCQDRDPGASGRSPRASLIRSTTLPCASTTCPSATGCTGHT